MVYINNEHDIFLRPTSAEQNATGLQNFGFNDFHSVKPSTAFHVLANQTVHIILSGSGTYHLNNNTHKLKAGQMFFTPTNIPLAYYPDSDDPWSYVWFSMYSDALAQYIPLLGLSLNTPYADIKNFEAVKNTVDILLKQLQNNSSQPIFCCISSFMQLLALEEKEITSSEDTKKIYIQSIKKHIDDNYSFQSFTVDALCDMMHLSHSYICRIFSAEEGCTVMNYIENVRLTKAAKLLKDTNLNVNSIAAAVGYKDSLHFMKRFKKKFGTTALEYRRQ